MPSQKKMALEKEEMCVVSAQFLTKEQDRMSSLMYGDRLLKKRKTLNTKQWRRQRPTTLIQSHGNSHLIKPCRSTGF